MKRTEIALEKFCNNHSPYNCSQSVLCAFAEDFGLDKETAKRIAVGFGVGMGRTQSVCGAVGGAIIVIGLKFGGNIEITYEKTRDFIRKFKDAKMTIECMDLLAGCNLLTEEGQIYFKENELKQKKCSEYVKLSCEILEEIIKQSK